MKLLRNRKFAAVVMVAAIALFSLLGSWRTLSNMRADALTADSSSHSALVQEYNRAISSFPANLVARLFGLELL